MVNRFIGIDSGSNGCIVAIDDNNNVTGMMDLSKDYQVYWEIIADWADIVGSYDENIVTVEDVCGRPGQSCIANTTFMKLAGMAELAGYCIGEMSKVKPQTWKKHFGLIGTKDMTKTEKKHLSIELAKKLFPSVADKLTASKDGRAEALLIALYGKEQWQMNPSM